MANKESSQDDGAPEESVGESIEHINNFIANSDEVEVKQENNAVYTEDNAATDTTPTGIPAQKPAKKTQTTTESRTARPAEPKKIEHRKPQIKKKPTERPKMKKIENKKPDHKKHEHKTAMPWLWISLAVVFIIAVAIILFKTSITAPATNQTQNPVAATVNGEAIYLSDINSQYDGLSPALKQVYTKEALLNQSIDELLLVQEAKNKNIRVAPSEVKAEIDAFKQQNNLNDQQLSTILKQQNLTMSQLESLIEKKLSVKDLLNQTILSTISVKQDDMQKYYQANLDSFKEPEKVKVSHILILVNDNVSDAAANATITNISKMLTADNFCQLVTQYSQDDGSKQDCGTYTFARGEMVQEFEDAAFDMKINETRIVKTVYGYHLIKKLDQTPARTKAYAEVEQMINQTLFDKQAQDNFDAYLASLRTKALIVNYLVAPQNATLNNTGNKSNLDSFAQCLTNKSVVFYGAYWCPHCENNKKMFGDSFKYVDYVECAVEGQPQVQTQACIDANITGYPTWTINGKQYAGEQTLEGLATLTGCSLNQ